MNSRDKKNLNYYVTDSESIYIDSYGDIFRGCKPNRGKVIATLEDDNVIEIVYNAVFSKPSNVKLNIVTVELALKCQSNCFYCFQNTDDRMKPYGFYEKLESFLNGIDMSWLFFLGGEILVQEESMRFIERIRTVKKNVWFHLKTNGNADIELCQFVSENFDSINVSFNGFTENTYNTIMGLSLRKTKYFCEQVIKMGKTNVCTKFLLSPAVAFELPEFVKWSLEKKVKSIIIQCVKNHDVTNGEIVITSMFKPDENTYWNQLFARVSKRVCSIIRDYVETSEGLITHISMDKLVSKLLIMDEDLKEKVFADGLYVIR